MIDIHPAPEQLAAFRLGKLGEDELADIEAHVAQCDSCCQHLKSLPDDSFVSLVRQTTDSTFAPELLIFGNTMLCQLTSQQHFGKQKDNLLS